MKTKTRRLIHASVLVMGVPPALDAPDRPPGSAPVDAGVAVDVAPDEVPEGVARERPGGESERVREDDQAAEPQLEDPGVDQRVVEVIVEEREDCEPSVQEVPVEVPELEDGVPLSGVGLCVRPRPLWRSCSPRGWSKMCRW